MMMKPGNGNKRSKLYYIYMFRSHLWLSSGGDYIKKLFESMLKYKILSFKMCGSKYISKYKKEIISILCIKKGKGKGEVHWGDPDADGMIILTLWCRNFTFKF